jgi:hypothetical protein
MQSPNPESKVQAPYKEVSVASVSRYVVSKGYCWELGVGVWEFAVDKATARSREAAAGPKEQDPPYIGEPTAFARRDRSHAIAGGINEIAITIATT